MAEPRYGLDYYQADIDMYSDAKFAAAQDMFDPEMKEPFLRYLVPHVAQKMLSVIYREGYYVEWNNEVSLRVSQEPGFVGLISNTKLKLFVKCLIECGFFSKDMFEKFSILTSSAIQRRWLSITVKLNRRGCVIHTDHDLLPTHFAKKWRETSKKLRENGKKCRKNGDSLCTTTTKYIGNTEESNTEDNKNSSSSKSSVGELPKSVGESEKSYGKTAKSVGELPKSVGEEVESVGESEKSYGKTAKSVGELPKSVGEQKIDGSTQRKKLDERNQHLPHSIDDLLWNYLHGKNYIEGKKIHAIRMCLDPDPEIALQKVDDWARAFARAMVNDGTTEMAMAGPVQQTFMKYFPNWAVRMIATRQGVDPNTLFTSEEIAVKMLENQRNGNLNGRKNEVEIPEPGPDADPEEYKRWWEAKQNAPKNRR